MHTCTYNPLRPRMFRSSSDHRQGILHQTSIYKTKRNVLYMFFDVKFPEDDLNNFETCRSIRGLYVKVYILVLGYLLVLCIIMFINARI
jgi:hypothetical protein